MSVDVAVTRKRKGHPVREWPLDVLLCSVRIRSRLGSRDRRKGCRSRCCRGGLLGQPATSTACRRAHYIYDECKNHNGRSEEHTSELQSLMRISYAVFCLKKKNHQQSH